MQLWMICKKNRCIKIVHFGGGVKNDVINGLVLFVMDANEKDPYRQLQVN